MLAAVARELHYRRLTSARVHLAAGLPLTWVSEQKESYRAYLLQNETVDFQYRGGDYHIEFVGADVFPQGYAAVADKLREFPGVNMLCDIGNGTMNIMYINNCRPVIGKCFTEKYGTHQCMLAARELLMRRCHADVDDAVIEQVFRRGGADITEAYLGAIRESATEYVEGIMRRLREHGYDPGQMRLYVMGGGSCLVRNFGHYDPERVTINSDVHATVNDHFARMERQTDDPYLETRQKEDAFLRRIEEAMERGSRTAMIIGRGELSAMPHDAAPSVPTLDTEETSEDFEASMEFISVL